MCGILGCFRNNSNNNNFINALSSLKHRGPDDFGYEFIKLNQNTLALGQTRLSIIDLSNAGHQPITSDCGNFILIFNGEIYNYIEIRNELLSEGFNFKTNTDTEVLLYSWKKWGPKCLNKFIGMFSFAIFDKYKNKLYCVRDQFGIKPFYYYVKNSNFYFCSEIPSLLKILPENPKINLSKSHDYLLYGNYDNSEETFFLDVLQLMPACYLEINLNEKDFFIIKKKWWNPEIKENKNITKEFAEEILKNEFLNSIKLHYRSDVAVGAALSGGLDSSSIVYSLRHLFPEKEIHTFSFISSDPNISEEIWVDKVNKSINAISHKIKISSEEFSNDLTDMIKYQGEPFMSTSIFAQYRIFKEANKVGIKVILDGQGADEILAGYNGYPVVRLKSMLSNFEIINIFKFTYFWALWPGRGLFQSFLNLISSLIPNKIKSFLTKKNCSWFDLKINKTSNKNKYTSFINKRNLISHLRNEILQGGLLSLLRHEDRNSMRFSIESRVPFLNKNIVEFLFSLPESFLISNYGETKHIFRRSMKNIIPDEILYRKDKIGFYTPEADWIKEQKDEILKTILIAKEIKFLNYDQILNDFNLFYSGKLKYTNKIWRMINYCKWYQIYFLT